MTSRATLRDDANAFREALTAAGSVTGLSRAVGIPRTTLQEWQRKHGIDSAPRGSTTQTSSTPGTRTYDVTAPVGVSTDDLLRKHGVDPDAFIMVSLHVQHAEAVGKGGEPIELQRVRVTLKEKPKPVDLGLLKIPEPKPLKFPKRAPVVREPRMHVVSSDPHHPYIEAGLQRCFLQFLHQLQPDEHTDLGDGQNASRFGRFGINRKFHDHLNDGLDSEVQAWHDEKQASPKTRRRRLPGNHDQHVVRYQLERAPALLGVRPGMLQEELEAGEELPDALSLRTLLRADELGIEMIEVEGEYHDARIQIAPGLVAVHGVGTGRRGAEKAVQRLLCSQLQGHDHFQKIEYVTRYDADHRAGDAAAVSVGTRAQRGLGYQKDGDVQQGFTTVMIWPDDRWHVELARWDDGELVWRDHRWRP